MIYGLNFGAPAIPPEVTRGVQERRRKGIPVAKGTVAILVGACNTDLDRHLMHIQATNGRRGLHWETKNGWHRVWAYTPVQE